MAILLQDSLAEYFVMGQNVCSFAADIYSNMSESNWEI